ncbi:hypothetical protein A5732_15400 [Mycobacterium colombiense]|nr:hypothetical protein A5732_15400 [Mycobacterium colombiense]
MLGRDECPYPLQRIKAAAGEAFAEMKRSNTECGAVIFAPWVLRVTAFHPHRCFTAPAQCRQLVVRKVAA